MQVAEATVSPTTNLDLLEKVSRPSLSAAPSRRKGWCNDYVPDESTIHRLLWAVNFLTENGFYVILDYQYNYDRSVTDDTGLWVAQVRVPPVRFSQKRVKSFETASS